MTKTTFQSLGIRNEFIPVLEKLEFKQPTEIQEKVIPAVLNGQSVIGQSRTGSGKTHAFLLPLIQQLDEFKQEVQMVITAPTRELAVQLHDEVRKIIQYANKEEIWTSKLLIGGTDKERMREKLKNPPHIVVGTPGRIFDMVDSGALSIYKATSFVIDEADLMLDLGFIADVDRLLVRTQKDIQHLVFSATIPEKLQHFFKKYLDQPVYIKVEEHFSPESMEHLLLASRHQERSKLIKEISTVIQPYLAIIFTNGKKEADDLFNQLVGEGLNIGILHGGLTPRERKRVLKEIQNLRYQYIIATDLASRGIDIKGVSHVINAELPKEEHFYIHRSGRTARAGLEGTTISIYAEEDLPLIKKLEDKGLNISYVAIRDREFVEAKPWNTRKLRQNQHQNADKEAWKQVKKAKKVKPGYKKKMKREQEQIKQKLARKKYKKR
jgi:ATP-dependent RNA helicase CshB